MPKILCDKAIIIYLFAMMGCVALYSAHILSLQWWIFGMVCVVGFFYFANRHTKLWINTRPIAFTKKLFWTAFALRVLWVLISYGLYHNWTGTPFSIGAADELLYDATARYTADMLRNGDWNLYTNVVNYSGYAFSDSGYQMYLSIIYWIFNDSILIARIIKALLSAWTVVFVYKTATRNFGESTGRMAGIFCMLMPNLIYYCSFQLKEVEMVFLAMLFVERADWLLRQPKLKLMPTIALILIPLLLFTIRTALAATLVAAFFCALLLTSGRVTGYGKRLVLIIAAGAFVLVMFFTSTSIGSDIAELWQKGGSGQKANMEWRSIRDNGNIYAKYAGAAVFAPLIFTIPFPTMTDVPHQENQEMIHGGNFVKNMMSYFTIMALVVLLFSGEWRKHVLPIAVLCGYLVVLVFSSFAQSERFHQPILPLTMMFAALGISLIKDNPWIKRYFDYWCVLMFLAAIAWNWFKLAGRGMI
jgi:4-amino-4-deoxy-L-arabinose transferase-like glycosyltransferase